MNKTKPPDRDIDFEYYKSLAKQLRHEAIRDLFSAAARSIAGALSRIKRMLTKGIHTQRRRPMNGRCPAP
jgi:hypothetical protein